MNDSAPRKRSTIIPIVSIFIVGAIIAVFFMSRNDYVAAAFTIVTAIGGIAGFRSGAISSAASIAGIVLATVFAPRLGRLIEVKTGLLLGTSGLTNRVTAIGLTGLGIILAVTILGAAVSSALTSDRKNVAAWDRWTGCAFGSLQAAAATVLLLGGLLVIEPMQRQRVNQMAIANPICNGVIATASHTRGSVLGPFIEKYNPFTRIPELNRFEQIQHSAQVFADPRRVHSILNSPEIMRLREDPKLNQAVAKLQQDEKIRDIINSDEPMNQQKLMTIMNSNAVLELMDQPGFADEFSNVLKSVSSAGATFD